MPIDRSPFVPHEKPAQPSGVTGSERGPVRTRPSRRRFPLATLAFCLGLLALASKAWAPTWWLFESPPSEAWVTCTPVEVLAFTSRVHVRCSERLNFGSGQTAVSFFAVPTNDDNSGVANRFTTITSAALSGGNRVRVLASYYDDGTSWGCQISNCKPARAVAIVP